MYKKCKDCGANLDPQESCNCYKQTQVERTIHTAAFAGTYNDIYRWTYLRMRVDENLPSCIADNIATSEARKQAQRVADDTKARYRSGRYLAQKRGAI